MQNVEFSRATIRWSTTQSAVVGKRERTADFSFGGGAGLQNLHRRSGSLNGCATQRKRGLPGLGHLADMARGPLVVSLTSVAEAEVRAGHVPSGDRWGPEGEPKVDHAYWCGSATQYASQGKDHLRAANAWRSLLRVKSRAVQFKESTISVKSTLEGI